MDIQKKKTSAFKVIGIKVRTSNALEMSGKGKIGATWGEFMSKGLASKIPHKINDSIVAAYCEYESDMNAPYTFFLGSMVDSTAQVPAGMTSFEVPAGDYAVVTTEKGEIPGIIMNAWKKIWDLDAKSEIKRKYTFDYEVYDSKAANPKSAQLDIFVSVK